MRQPNDDTVDAAVMLGLALGALDLLPEVTRSFADATARENVYPRSLLRAGELVAG